MIVSMGSPWYWDCGLYRKNWIYKYVSRNDHVWSRNMVIKENGWQETFCLKKKSYEKLLDR